jgi:hypothetical protein
VEKGQKKDRLGIPNHKWLLHGLDLELAYYFVGRKKSNQNKTQSPSYAFDLK